MYRNESSDTDLGKTFQIKVVSNLPQVIRLATLVLFQTYSLHYENKDISPKFFWIVKSQGRTKDYFSWYLSLQISFDTNGMISTVKPEQVYAVKWYTLFFQ